MKIEKAIPAIIEYCREWIEDFDLRAELAFNMSFRERIPIENASPSLADSITEHIGEWCEDNDCENLADEITVEDIILNM